MVRLSLVLLFGLVVMSCCLASSFESGPELIQAAFRGRLLYGRFLQWKADQPADSDTSFATFYSSLRGEAAERQLAQREAAEGEPTEKIDLGHDNGELQNLYGEWKKIQPEGSSGSFENYLGWLRDQRTLRELSADGSDAGKNSNVGVPPAKIRSKTTGEREVPLQIAQDPDDAAIEKRGCTYGCSCCPLSCGIRCDW